MNEDRKEQPKFRFQAEDTKGGSVKFHLLFKERMRRMIASKESDSAIRHTFD